MNTVYTEIHPNRSKNTESAGRNSLRVKCSTTADIDETQAARQFL